MCARAPSSSTLFYSFLRSSPLLCASQAERARRVIDALASDDELREFYQDGHSVEDTVEYGEWKLDSELFPEYA